MFLPFSFSWIDLGWHGRLKRPKQARQRQVWVKLQRQQLLLEVGRINVLKIGPKIRQNLLQA
jgi:hypothetical protein